MVRIVVIGGGLVGLATAWQLAGTAPDARVTVLEKEDGPARHQSGRNSGVLHSGIYYRPGSLRAGLCRSGKAEMEAFCATYGIAFARCGKVVVATDAAEHARLLALAERASANGVAARLIGADELRAIEPHARGVAALHVAETGVADFRGVADRLVALLREAGHTVRFGARVTTLRRTAHGCIVGAADGADVEADRVVACAGLLADRVAALAGSPVPARIVPFRGEYWALVPERRALCRALIYPVPDPALPFLGVHFTRGIDGMVECGPNAVLALAREGYRRRDVACGDVVAMLSWPGTWRLFARHWRTGLTEVRRSLSRRAFAAALARLVPDIGPGDLTPHPAGVRAQAVARDGSLLDDFAIVDDGPFVHVLNAPSPAATASLAIGRVVAARVLARAT